MQIGAHELRRSGVTIVPVADSSIQPLRALFDELMCGKSSLAELSDGEHLCGFDDTVKVEVKTTMKTDGSNYLKYANFGPSEGIIQMCKPFMESLQPLLSEAFGELVVPVGSQFILGHQHGSTRRHADFFNRYTATLLTPLFDYAPENASFYYWKPNLVSPTSNLVSSVLGLKCVFNCDLHCLRHTYPYRRGEGVLFRGDIFHQTAPFSVPADGWGESKCRALFAIVMVAPNRFQRSLSCRVATGIIQSTSGGHARIPTSKSEYVEQTVDATSLFSAILTLRWPTSCRLISAGARCSRCCCRRRQHVAKLDTEPPQPFPPVPCGP